MLKVSRILVAQVMQQKLSEDIFFHFTSREVAETIIQDHRLREDMIGSSGRGTIHAICAISAIWGKYVPSVQHGEGRDLVALEFTTNVKPDYGYVEEVIWHQDVPFLTLLAGA